MHASLSLLGAPLLTLDLSSTGPLPSAGGFLQTSLLTINPNLSPLFLNAEVADAIASGQGLETDAWSSTTSLSLGLQTIALLPPQLNVSADVIQANVSATCPNATASTPNYSVIVSGSSLLANLKISASGLAVAVPLNPAPNTVIAIPGVARIVLNEQISSTSSTSGSGTGSITVNAIHITLDKALAAIAGGDIVVSDAKAGITCAAPPPKTTPPPINCPVSDFVTYGGYIAGPNGGKANFGGVGGYKPNSTTRTGHLNYVDHGAGGPHLNTGTVGSYVQGTNDPTTRIIGYGCDASSTTGCKVTVDDLGEPGSSDTFRIDYPSASYIAAGTLGGGNVQLHKPAGCPQ